MKFTIRALIFLTLLVAVAANAFLQWNRIARAKADIQSLESEIKAAGFDAAYVDSHTLVCERAIENNPLPSPYYLSAKRRHEELIPLKSQDEP